MGHTLSSMMSTWTINRGEKSGLVGKNGEGKSTLRSVIIWVRLIMRVNHIRHNVQIGYFAQNQAQMLDENLTVFDTIDRVAVGDIRLKIRDILELLCLVERHRIRRWKCFFREVSVHVWQWCCFWNSVNFLILDEPTNHLDMRSKDVLKEAIREFDGTVIIVSHDRDFLMDFCD